MAASTSPATLERPQTLDRDSLIPLYHQLYEILRSQIERGVWKPGDMIPPESELKQMYDVSQITVRQALENLVDYGLIYRRRGQGTFVAQPRIASSMTRLLTFAEDMRQRGMEPLTKLIDCTTAPLSKHTAVRLEAEPDDEMVIIKRLRYADGEPLSYEVSCLLHKYVPGIMNKDLNHRSLKELLMTDYNIVMSSAQQTIRAQIVPPDMAHGLHISEDDPVLIIERITRSQHNTPIEFLRIVYRADRYELHHEL
jgi:GntR family transcriptional regulator